MNVAKRSVLYLVAFYFRQEFTILQKMDKIHKNERTTWKVKGQKITHNKKLKKYVVTSVIHHQFQTIICH